MHAQDGQMKDTRQKDMTSTCAVCKGNEEVNSEQGLGMKPKSPGVENLKGTKW